MAKKKIIFIFIGLMFSPDISHTQTNSDWQILIRVQIENREYKLCFGIAEHATDRFDIGIDSLAPPPAFTPHVTFWIEDFPNTLQRDIRGGDSLVVWNLRIFNANADTCRISWETIDFDSSGTLALNDSINMLTNNSIVVIGNQQIRISHSRTTTSVKQPNKEFSPNNFEMINYPNPFADFTTIEMKSIRNSPVTIRIFNIIGQEIFLQNYRSSIQNRMILSWDGRDKNGIAVPNGMYFVRVEMVGAVHVKKIFRIQ